MLTFTIVLVIALEMLNTSIEAMTDLLTRKYAVEARIAKDTAAGMVLVGAIGAIIVGIIIFYPYIF
jgi:diacylglycerol kinase